MQLNLDAIFDDLGVGQRDMYKEGGREGCVWGVGGGARREGVNKVLYVNVSDAVGDAANE